MAKRYIGDTNIFDPSTVSLDTRIYWNTGQEFQAAGWSITDYIPVNQGWSYHSEGLLKYMIVGYDENKQYLGVYNADIDSFDKNGAATSVNSFTNSSAYGVLYIRLYANFYFSQGFEFYENAHWEPCAVKWYHKSPNLIDESVIENGELDPYTGYVSPAPGLSYVTTDFIHMLPDTYTISFKALTGWATSGKALSFARYDENRQYIEGRRWTLPSATTGESFYFSFGGAQYYIKFCWESDYVEKPMLYLGSDELPYEPYSNEVWHDADIFIRQKGVWVRQ